MLYPNPAADNLSIAIFQSSDGEKDLKIYNALGAVVLEAGFYSQKHSVNVSRLTEGIYITEIKNEKNIVRKKFVKE